MDPFIRFSLDAPPLAHFAGAAGSDRPFLHPDRVLDYHVLLFVSVGEIRVIEDGIEHVVSAGDVLLLKAGLRHWGETPFALGTRWLFVHFWLAEQALEELEAADGQVAAERADRQELSELRGPSPGAEWSRNDFKRTFRLPKKASPADRNACETRLAAIDRMFRSTHPARGALASAALTELLIELGMHAADAEGLDRPDMHVRHLVSLLESTLDRTLSAEEIEAHMRMNYRYLCRIFRAGTGRTLREYHMTLRMDEACRLMRETGLNVSETAARVGFADPLYFSHVFRRVKGQPPSAYMRRAYRTERM